MVLLRRAFRNAGAVLTGIKEFYEQLGGVIHRASDARYRLANGCFGGSHVGGGYSGV